MIERDTIVVGAGPAGSAAAWQLRRKGQNCLVLDRAVFPRDKLCAGWITPEVLTDLAFTADDYPHRFLTFEKLNISLWGMSANLGSVQHSIRRCEFDAWLLERSDAEVTAHNVRHVSREGDTYVIDDKFRCRNLIGAGGTSCPVYRDLFRTRAPRDKVLQAVALELEYAHAWQDASCHLWFMTDRLPGYSWYVPKAQGYLNIGVGGMAYKLNQRGDSIQNHWDTLANRLLQKGLINEPPARPHGYSYYLRDTEQMVQIGNAYLVGDALGLATRDLCEGIGPAVRSGIAAANAITTGESYSLQSISPFTSSYGLVKHGLEYAYLHRTGDTDDKKNRSLFRRNRALSKR